MKTIQITERIAIEQVIAQCDVCYVGLVDEDNRPYVIPMNFGYRDNIIYLHSAPEGRSIRILEKNNNVCITFSRGHRLAFQHPQVACSYRMKSQSVIAFCEVTFVEEKEKKIEILNILMGQYSDKEFQYSDPAVANVKIWRAEIKQMTCKEFGAPHK